MQASTVQNIRSDVTENTFQLEKKLVGHFYVCNNSQKLFLTNSINISFPVSGIDDIFLWGYVCISLLDYFSCQDLHVSWQFQTKLIFFSTCLVYYWMIPTRERSMEEEILSECAQRILTAVFSHFYNRAHTTGLLQLCGAGLGGFPEWGVAAVPWHGEARGFAEEKPAAQAQLFLAVSARPWSCMTAEALHLTLRPSWLKWAAASCLLHPPERALSVQLMSLVP